MVGQTIIILTARKGRVTKLESLKVLTNKTPIYITIKVVSQTPKQAKRGNLPTCPDVTSFLTLILGEAPDTLVVRMDLNSL